MPDAQTAKVSMAEEELKSKFREDGGEQTRGSRKWNCPKDEAIAAYVDLSVDARARSRIESHLADCGYCRGLVADVVRMKGSDAPAIPVQLKQRAAALAAPRSRSLQWILWPATAAGAACVLIVTLWVRSPQQAIVPSPAPTASAPAAAVIAKSEPAPTLRQQSGEVERKLAPTGHLPVLIFPKQDKVVAPEQLEFRWKGIPRSRYYEIRVVTSEGDLVWSGQSEQVDLKLPSDLKLKDGAYFIWISAYMDDGRVQKSATVRFQVSASR
jgi:hypothetical protein